MLDDGCLGERKKVALENNLASPKTAQRGNGKTDNSDAKD